MILNSKLPLSEDNCACGAVGLAFPCSPTCPLPPSQSIARLLPFFDLLFFLKQLKPNCTTELIWGKPWFCLYLKTNFDPGRMSHILVGIWCSGDSRAKGLSPCICVLTYPTYFQCASTPSSMKRVDVKTK